MPPSAEMSIPPTTPQSTAIQRVAKRPHKRPRLYAIATKPSIPNQPASAEWSLDLCVPPTTIDSEHISQGEGPSSPPSVGSIESEEEQRYYFNRFDPTTFSQVPPADIVARISLSSVPSGAESPVESIELVHQISSALESVYLTPDSASWLRQALFALQKAEILPGVASGFVVNNFMSFATTYLEQQVQKRNAESSEVKYSAVLRSDERLRRMTVCSEQAPRYTPSTLPHHHHDDLDNDEYEWSLPYRGKQARDGVTWNGFRAIGGSTSSSRSGSYARRISDPWGSSDIYGGILQGRVTST